MFAERLTKLIEERGISRYKIAQDTKITEATLSNYCNGKGKPNPSLVKQLAAYFGADYDWLIGDSDERSQNAQESEGTYFVKEEKVSNINLRDQIVKLESQLSKNNDEINKLALMIEQLSLLIEEKFDILFPKTAKNQPAKQNKS